MLYFLASTEGGKFIRIVRKKSIRPKILIKRFIKQKLKCVVVFKNGIIYDGFLLYRGYKPLRHLKEKKEGKLYYKQLLKYNLSEETIT